MGTIIKIAEPGELMAVQSMLHPTKLADLQKSYDKNPQRMLIPLVESRAQPGTLTLVDGHHRACLAHHYQQIRRHNVELYGWVARSSEDEMITPQDQGFHTDPKSVVRSNTAIKAFFDYHAYQLDVTEERKDCFSAQTIANIVARYSSFPEIETIRKLPLKRQYI